MTTTENTTRSSNNTITRRKMLQSAAVLSAATILYSSSSTAREKSQLSLLIERQKEARAAANMAWDKRDDLSDAFREVKQTFVLVPFSVAADGSAPHGLGEFAVLGETSIRKKIEEAHAELRRKFSSKWATVSMPEVVAAAENAIRESEAKAMTALADAVADERSRYKAAGIADADAECEALEAVLRATTADVEAFRPKSLDDVATKVHWLMAEYDGCMIEDDVILSLLPEGL